MKKSKEGITVKKEDNFSEWYTEVITKTDLADYTKVSGCIVFKPKAYQIWEKIQELTNQKLKKLGIKNTYFPLLIPESLLKKEQEHVKGFAPEVAWVTQTGSTKIPEKLAIRPTSEAIMYDSYSKWIRSHKDLPLKLCQWNNVLRWEFKHPVPFLRTREFLWVEGHTVFATEKEAEKEIKDIMKIWKDICENHLALYGIAGRKTDKEKFAGAVYTQAYEYFLPNGKAIQGPDTHYDGQNFAKAYNIKFLNKKEKQQYPYQNTWAITTRMLGIMFATHSDNKGLVLPPKIASTQVIIIPILFKDSKKQVLKQAQKIKSELKGVKTEIDTREEHSPGWKFNEYELKGIPIRIEIGPKDLKKKQVVVVRRDNSKKEIIKIKDLKKQIPELLNHIQNSLYNKSKKHIKSSTKEVKNLKELQKAIKENKLVLAQWCKLRKCEEEIKEKTEGAKTLVIPFNQKIKGNCVLCGEKSKAQVYISKSY